MGAQVVEHLIHLIATVSPGAKLGSTAPYSYADLMLIEIGARQPRSLANAFRNSITAQTADATAGLAAYLTQLDNAYGVHEARRVMSIADCDVSKRDPPVPGRPGLLGGGRRPIGGGGVICTI